MKDEAKDVKESQTCRNGHILQYIEEDDDGKVWQLCCGCDRKLFVRS